MKTTQNLNLGKPLVSEKYDISVFNSNADKIDSAIKDLQNKTTAASADNAGIVMLNDDTESDSTTTAATANSVKKVNDKISGKVDKVPGKSLSSNDLTNDLKANYNAAFEHSVSDHARIDATLTQASSANGNIKINGSETVVYTHPAVHSAMMITEDSSHRFVTDEEKSSYADKYTRNEVDNKFSTLETSIDWKESVETFADIAKTYPNPQDGWTVNVKDTDYTYRYNGAAWVTISANAIPKATAAVDGLLSKEDKTKLDSMISTYATKTEVNELKKSVSDGKRTVAGAVTAKGVNTAADAAFQTIANNIMLIETGMSDEERKQMWGERYTTILSCGRTISGISNSGGSAQFYFDPIDARVIARIYFECYSPSSLTSDEDARIYMYVQNREEDIYDEDICLNGNVPLRLSAITYIYEYDNKFEYVNQIYGELNHNLNKNVTVLLYPVRIVFRDGTEYTYDGPTYSQSESTMNYNAKTYKGSVKEEPLKNYYIKQALTEMYKGLQLWGSGQLTFKGDSGNPLVRIKIPIHSYLKTIKFVLQLQNLSGAACDVPDSNLEIQFKNALNNTLKAVSVSTDTVANVSPSQSKYYYSESIVIPSNTKYAYVIFKTDTKDGWAFTATIADVTFNV